MRYSRMFSALFFGIVFMVAGLIGYDLSQRNSFSAGTRWTDGLILSQVAAGLALLAMGIYWARRLDDPRTRVRSGALPRLMNVGSGQSKGATLAKRRRLQTHLDR